jgi:hypothetical protein
LRIPTVEPSLLRSNCWCWYWALTRSFSVGRQSAVKVRYRMSAEDHSKKFSSFPHRTSAVPENF